MKVAVGLSGGVDSAVSALLLKRQGCDVTGVHLQCWPPRGEKVEPGCRADEDRKLALKTVLELEIPFKVLDFRDEYEKKVVEYFYREYEVGRTPNPDVMCNSEIKFGMFLNWAMEEGFDYMATGHYALIRFERTTRGQVRLFIPKDKHKDQTYFLYKLGQKELGHVLFPLGDYLKNEVREMAEKAGLSVSGRPDSQGICFVGKVDVKGFLKKRLNEKVGKVLDVDGKVIGEHDGVWFYTIGQRGGWRMTVKMQAPIPVLYVVGKNIDKNELVMGEGKDALVKSFEVGEVNWIAKKKPSLRTGLFVRIRHGGELVPVKIDYLQDLQGCTLKVRVERGLRGVAPGQAAVFYSKGGECLGGGVIV